MHKGFLKTASILAAISVLLGAFAAHSLKGVVGQNAISTFETAVRYQFYHVLALFITAIIYKEYPVKTVMWAGRFFIAGILLFSGSLYFIAYKQAIVFPLAKWIGLITPLGGVAFVAGWVLLAITFFKTYKSAAL